MITTKLSTELRPGDVLSTDGSMIESVVLLQGGGVPDEVCIVRTFPAEGDLPAVQRIDYVATNEAVHVWTPDA